MIELKPERYTHSRKTSLTDTQDALLQKFLDANESITEAHAIRYMVVTFLEKYFNSTELNQTKISDSQPRRGRKKKEKKS